MNTEYKALFDKLSPQKSDDELVKAIFDRKAEKMNEKKKTIKKAVVIPAVAAALVLCTTVGVSAAYQWNLPAAMRSIFGGGSSEESGAKTYEYKEFDFAAIGGKELSDVVECEGFKIALKGVAADQHTSYLMYDVIFGEDFDYALEEGEILSLNLHPRMEMSWGIEYFKHQRETGEDAGSPGFSVSGGFLGAEGNVFHYYRTVAFTGITTQDKTVTYLVDSFWKEKDGESTKFKSFDEKEITVSYDFDTTALKSSKLAPEAPVALDCGVSGKLAMLELSTFQLRIMVNWDDKETALRMNDQNVLLGDEVSKTVLVRFKDGTTRDITTFDAHNVGVGVGWNGDTDKAYSDMSLSWDYPVNVSDIESVTICGVTVPVSQ